jgi:hypothetical protein
VLGTYTLARFPRPNDLVRAHRSGSDAFPASPLRTVPSEMPSFKGNFCSRPTLRTQCGNLSRVCLNTRSSQYFAQGPYPTQVSNGRDLGLARAQILGGWQDAEHEPFIRSARIDAFVQADKVNAENAELFERGH